MRSRLQRAVFAVTLVFAAGPVAYAASVAAPIGTGGAVASADPLATAAGLEILRAGGNAVDAAVATALALAVVYPEAGNLGGGGFAVMRIGGAATALDFRETAPAKARPDMYLDAAGKAVPKVSLVGPLATGVPGSPAGYHVLHQRFGRLPWTRVVAPAVRLAREGFAVSRDLAAQLVVPRQRASLESFPESAAVWYPGGAPLAFGVVKKLPQLAATLERYAAEGPTAITTGTVAAAIERASKAHGGILTSADLAAYRPVWRQSLAFEAFGWHFATMPLPSSGGIILGQSLGMLERIGYQRLPRFGAARAHRLSEVLRRAFSDRLLLGDPTSTRATERDLLEPAWLDARALSIDGAHATLSTSVGTWSAAAATAVPSGGSDTTHLSVVDRDGNLVALTTSLNDNFGCGLLVPEAGFLLNNTMDDFATAPGQPNLYGLVQGEANAVGAGKRMLSSMAPVLAWRGDEAYAMGARGGSRIPTSVLQVLLAAIVDGDRLQAAVNRPRIHHQWLPDQIEPELDALSPESRVDLERRGHRVMPSEITAKVHAVHRMADGRVEAASDPRGPGAGGVVTPE